jgi:cysteine desulfurase / selenocysteine lyase
MTHFAQLYRDDFPSLQGQIYFDNAATTQKPNAVMEKVLAYNQTIHANPHRGAYKNSVLATQNFEAVRAKVQKWIGAKSLNEIIFTRGTTESINLVARSFGATFLKPGDEILLTIAEHHSNILPWQWVCKQTGATLKYVYLTPDGQLDLEGVKASITDKTKLVCITHISNVLGTVFPIKEVSDLAHAKGSLVLVDGAQSIAHLPLDVCHLGADFFVFSGHKIYGPTGIGVLYGREEWLRKMPPFLMGGNMIEYVNLQDATFAPLPNKFEAGTQNIEGVIGLGEALDYIEKIGLSSIEQYEKDLTQYALQRLQELHFISIQGPTSLKDRSAVISFTVSDVHPHDVSTIMDNEGISLRSGHHCAQPLMAYLGLPATCRVSFSFYNTLDEIDCFIDKLKTVRKWLGYGS